jgi:redox-sensitive bicupin YhaK (pirin superfamily)
MLTIRKTQERGKTEIDWLESYHAFSFDQYYDPEWEHFRMLRVINEDFVKPGAGFHPHSHRDMEIITYILEGALEHKDSMGNGSMIKPGEVQRMSAGTGVTHSEFNPSDKERVHLLQIWILPQKKGIDPGYEQKTFPEALRRDKLCLIVSPKAEKGAVKIHQDAQVYASLLNAGKEIKYSLKSGRHAWIQAAKGAVLLNDTELKAGDGAGISNETSLVFNAKKDSEFLLFDLN